MPVTRQYADMVVTVAKRLNYGAIVHNAALLTDQAEKYISKKLRVKEMEKDVTLTLDSNGTASLPSDFMDLRVVERDNKVVDGYSLVHIVNNTRCGYNVKGSSITFNPVSGGNPILSYYAALPSLESNSTNWLFQSDENVYIQALSFQALVEQSKVDEAQVVSSYLDQLIEEQNVQDYSSRYRGQRVSVRGITP